MKSTVSNLAALLLLGAGASLAGAGPYPYYWGPPPAPPAPDACGAGQYYVDYYGRVQGPVYYVRPSWEPFNGFRPQVAPNGFPSAQNFATARAAGMPMQLPSMNGAGQAGAGAGAGAGPGTLTFPTHPFARSPRDFFMMDDKP